MGNALFPKKAGTALLALLVCLLPLGSVTFAQAGPISDGIVISAQVAGSPSVVPPSVTTDDLVTTGETGATLLGAVTDAGDSGVTLEGFDYGLDTSYGTTTISSGSFGIGAFSASVSGLVCDTHYHYRAYAENGAGRSFGSDKAFTTSDCPVIPPPVPSPGAGGASLFVTSSTVNFSGTAYPGSRVTILRDGVVLASAATNARGAFLLTVSGIDAGSYVFSVYATDPGGITSVASSFPFVMNGRSIVNISGIVLAPTVGTDKAALAAGDKLTISGYAAPASDVRISVGLMSTFAAHAGISGSYSYTMDTSALPSGTYTVRAQVGGPGQQGPASKAVTFFVSRGTLAPGANENGNAPGANAHCATRPADLNCDGRVDIVDFSILKYWYGRENPPAKVDLSGDGAVTLKDFSILAAEWTG